MGRHLQLKPDHQGGSGGEVHHPMISGLRLGLGLGGEHRVKVRVSIRVRDSKLGGEILHQRPPRLQG